jgi:predicted permease
VDAAVTALVPILALIGLGHLLRRSGFVAEAFWRPAEKMTYFVLMPVLLVHSLSTRDFGSLPWLSVVTSVYLPLLVTAALLFAARQRIGRGDAAAFTSVFQGGVRFNTYIGLALATAFFGNAGLAIGAVVAGFMIVLVNILCVIVFYVTVPQNRTGPGRIAVDLARNPLILGCVIGAALSMTGMTPRGALSDTLRILGGAALPLGLICVGASLQWSGISRHLRPFGISALAQFLIKPSLAALFCWILQIAAPASTIIVMFLALPTAPSAYVLARQLGGDHRLMAAIVTLQTVVAFVTLPVTFRLLGLP